MIQKEIKTVVFEYSSEKELSEKDQELISRAREALKKAYAPYSKFNVGACVLLANGEMFSGNNQENAAYPSGLCAERVALFYANSVFPDVPDETIAICASNENGYVPTPVPPCGSCRQVLLESEIRFNHSIKVILIGSAIIQVIEGIQQLLPLNFQKDNLFE